MTVSQAWLDMNDIFDRDLEGHFDESRSSQSSPSSGPAMHSANVLTFELLFLLLGVDCDDTCCPGFEGSTMTERQCCRSTNCSMCTSADSTLTTPAPLTIWLAPYSVPHCAKSVLNGSKLSCSFPCSATGNLHDFLFHAVVRNCNRKTCINGDG